MKLVANTTSEVGAVVLLDPEALPRGLVERTDDDLVGVLNELAGEGRLFWAETDFAEQASLHLYVDETVPPALFDYCESPVEIISFAVPSGTLWFTGAERVFPDGASTRQLNPPRSGMTVRPGYYRARILTLEYPLDHVQRHVRGRIGFWANDLRESVPCLFLTAMLLTGAAGILLIASFGVETLVCAGVTLIPWLGLYLFTRTQAYRAWNEQAEAVTEAYPDIAAELRWQSPIADAGGGTNGGG